MVIGDLLKVGDKVLIAVPQENRDWGFRPAPDGTEVEVLGFAEIDHGRTNNFGNPPGIYPNFCWVDILLPDGKTMSINHCHLAERPEDKGEFSQREKEWREKGGIFAKKTKLRDLPETPFWEGDKVSTSFKREGDPDPFTIIRIDYLQLGTFCTDGVTPYPCYSISESFGAGWHTSARESELTLVERGDVWKHYHDEPVTFNGLGEEVDFYHRLGGYDEEVRNPKNDLYCWTIEEAVAAVKKQVGDYIRCGNSFLGGTHISVYKCKDEDLGKRLREATAEGFRK